MRAEHLQEVRSPQEASRETPRATLRSEARVTCPRCHRATESLKEHEIANVVSLVVYLAWNAERTVACPSCLRWLLFKKALLAIPLANLFFPFVWLLYLGPLAGTAWEGHSNPEVAEAHRVTREELVARASTVVSLHKASRKEWVLLALVLLACVAFWAVCLALSAGGQ
jgi:hypothetical protein